MVRSSISDQKEPVLSVTSRDGLRRVSAISPSSPWSHARLHTTSTITHVLHNTSTITHAPHTTSTITHSHNSTLPQPSLTVSDG